MLVLGLDLETSGLDFTKDLIIEIGAILWDTKEKSPKKIYNELIYYDQLELSSEVQNITKINSEDLKNYGVPLSDALKTLRLLSEKAKFFSGPQCH